MPAALSYVSAIQKSGFVATVREHNGHFKINPRDRGRCGADTGEEIGWARRWCITLGHAIAAIGHLLHTILASNARYAPQGREGL